MKRFLILLALLALAITPSFAQDSGRTPITVDNASNLSQLIRLGRGSAEHAQWSPDGNHVLVGGTLGVWKYDATALDTPNEPQLIATTGTVAHFAISPDGTTIAISITFRDGSNQIEYHDFTTGNLIDTIEDTDQNLYLTYNRDGNLLVAHNGSGGIIVYEGVDIFTEVDTALNRNAEAIISPDNTQLIAIANGNDILVWDLGTDNALMTLDAHTSTVNDIAISDDGSMLVSVGSLSDDRIIMWDLQTGEILETISLAEESRDIRSIYTVAFSDDDTTLLTGHSNTIRTWDTATLTVTGEFPVDVRLIEDVEFSPDNSQFIISTTLDSTDKVQLYNIDGTLVATTFYHNERINTVTFSADSTTLAFNDYDNILYLWDTISAEEITSSIRIEESATPSTTNTNNIVYSNNNQYIAVIEGRGFELRNPTTGELIYEFTEGIGRGESIEFSPDSTLLTFITELEFYVFDVETGTQLAYFDDANNAMTDIAWSPDQTMLATASTDHAVRIYTIP